MRRNRHFEFRISHLADLPATTSKALNPGPAGYVPRAAERAIFDIVGSIALLVGEMSRANNV